MWRLNPVLTISTLAAVAITAATASAEQGQADGRLAQAATAEALDERARTAFDAGDYQAALEALRAAQVVDPASPRLYNMAQCHEALDQRDEALALYRQYLAADDLPPGRRRLAEQRVELLTESPEAPATTAEPAVTWIEAWEVDPSVSVRGPFWGLVATTSALTVGAVVLGAITLARHADFTSRYYEDEQVPRLADVGHALALSTDVLVALAASSAIATLVVGLVWRHRLRERRAGAAGAGPRD